LQEFGTPVGVTVGVAVGVSFPVGVGVGVSFPVGVGVGVSFPVGVGVGEPVDVDMVKVRAQASPPAFGILDGTFGETDCDLNSYNLRAVNTATPARIRVKTKITAVPNLPLKKFFIYYLVPIRTRVYLCRNINCRICR
jgi:hypothetical protein